MTKKKDSKKQDPVEGEVHLIRKLDGMDSIIGDGYDYKGVKSNAVLYEDDFANFYNQDLNGGTVLIMEPPYNLVQLERICSESNALEP